MNAVCGLICRVQMQAPARHGPHVDKPGCCPTLPAQEQHTRAYARAPLSRPHRHDQLISLEKRYGRHGLSIQFAFLRACALAQLL